MEEDTSSIEEEAAALLEVDGGFARIQTSPLQSETVPGCEGSSLLETAPSHEALSFVLPYLPLADLLSVRMVCRSLRDAVNGDPLIWRNLIIEPPLSSKVKDLVLWDLVSKANGSLASLVLNDCRCITDAGLFLIAVNNPCISKLHVPGCIGLTPDGIVIAVKTLRNLKSLRINGLANLRKVHLETLNSVLSINPKRPLVFYGGDENSSVSNSSKYPWIDMDICPKCNEVRLVFDCPREQCQRKDGLFSCRGCFYCITRCKECGVCISIEEVEGETVCPDFLCWQCWLRLPKCKMCNQASCSQHLHLQSRDSSSSGFTCEVCSYFTASSSPTMYI